MVGSFSDMRVRIRGNFRDNVRAYDGYDSSRDMVSLYSKEGSPQGPYKFKVEFANLKPDAGKNLDLYVLVNFGGRTKASTKTPDGIAGNIKKPWQISLCIYDLENHVVKDADGNDYKGHLKDVKFNCTGRSIEFSLDKEILRKFGWKDGQSLSLQAIASKDGVKKIMDFLPPLNSAQALPSSSPVGRVSAGADMNKTPSFWEDEVIYFAFTDRFNNGDKTNDGPDTNLKDPYAFHGGDWQGIIDKLDYIKDLGCSTVWISPVVLNEPKGYHSYWPYDFMSPEKHFGDPTKLKELVKKAHEKGMKVVVDIVVNHTGYTHPWTKNPDYYDWFHHYGGMRLATPWQMENCDFAGLPDLAQENPKVYDYLLNMAKYWIKESDCDGVRLDAAQNISRDFWKKFTQDIRNFTKPDFLLLGEAFNPFPGWVGSYQKDGLDSMFDVPMAWAIRDVFAYNKKKNLIKRIEEAKEFFWDNPCDSLRKVFTTNSGNMRELQLFLSQDSHYDNPNLLVTFLDNHDVSRFMEEAGDPRKLKLALAFLFTMRGFPAFYYGTEVGLTGGGKNNAFRKDMDWNYDNPEIRKIFKKLAGIRKEHIALRRGVQKELHADRNIYAFARLHTDEEAICIFNNSEKEKKRAIKVKGCSLIKEGSILKNLLGDDACQVKDGGIILTLKPKEAKILVLSG